MFKTYYYNEISKRVFFAKFLIPIITRIFTFGISKIKILLFVNKSIRCKKKKKEQLKMSNILLQYTYNVHDNNLL